MLKVMVPVGSDRVGFGLGSESVDDAEEVLRECVGVSEPLLNKTNENAR